MQNFNWCNPTRVLFGKGSVKDLAEYLKADNIKSVLLIYGGKSVFKCGAYTQVTDMLNELGISFPELNDIKPNPRIDKVRDGIARVKLSKIDALMPIGGGSVFDTAKAISAGAFYNGDVWDIYQHKAKINKTVPIYGVVTASATASEVNAISVISNPEANIKTSFSDSHLYPKIVTVDPEFQFTLSEKQTVYGGVDIIAHALERLLDGDEGSEFMDDQGYALVRNMLRIIPELIDDPKNYDARAEYAWASQLAHNGILSCGRATRGDFSSHRLGHSISLLFDVAHGASLSVTMPAWARYLYKFNPVPFARLGENVFDIFDGSDEEKALATIEALEDFYRDINAPTTLRELNIKEDEIQQLADNASKSGALPFGTLKKLNQNDVLEIYKLAY